MAIASAKTSTSDLTLGHNYRHDDQALDMARKLALGSISASQFLFGFALVVYLASSIVNQAMIQAFVPSVFFTAGRVGALALLLLSELLDARRVDVAVWVALILLPLGVVIAYLSDLSNPLMILAFVWSSRRVSFEFSAKCALWTIMFMCAIVWISWRGGSSLIIYGFRMGG